jgi:hypothetical protein
VGLASVVPRALRVQGAREISGKIAKAVSTAREGIQALRDRVERDPLGAHEHGLRGLEEAAAPLVALLDRVDDESARKVFLLPEVSRGRNLQGPVEIAALVVREYRTHFNKLPGSSKQEDAANPYAAVCRVVERLLADAGYTVALGYEARAKALGRYRQKVERNSP